MASLPEKGPQTNLDQHLARLNANRRAHSWGCLYSLPNQNPTAFAVTNARSDSAGRGRYIRTCFDRRTDLQVLPTAHLQTTSWTTKRASGGALHRTELVCCPGSIDESCCVMQALQALSQFANRAAPPHQLPGEQSLLALDSTCT